MVAGAKRELRELFDFRLPILSKVAIVDTGNRRWRLLKTREASNEKSSWPVAASKGLLQAYEEKVALKFVALAQGDPEAWTEH